MTDNSDPLQNPAFKKPGLSEKLGEIFLGRTRPLNCVQVEVTSHCGGQCVYCPHTTQAKSWKARHMTASTFARLWPLLRRSERAHLQGWGEPLLNPRFFDFVALARKAGCQVSTTSCGLQMNDDIAARLIGSGMDMIAFSLAGTDSASNSARAGVAFDKVRRSIALLRSVMKTMSPTPQMEIHLAYLLLADRVEAVASLPALMDELDVEMAVVSTLDYLSIPAHRDLAYAPHETAKIEKARMILEKAASEAEESGRLIHYALPNGEAQTRGGCRENAEASLYVDADGAISPCVYLNVPGSDPAEKRRVFGYANTEDPWSVWKNDEYAAFRQALRNPASLDICRDCPKRHESS